MNITSAISSVICALGGKEGQGNAFQSNLQPILAISQENWEVTGMRISKFVMSFVAAAVVMAFTAAPGLQAATYLTPGSKAQTETLVDHVAAKKKSKKKAMKKKHKKHKMHKKGPKAAPGKCGMGKYYKKGKCLSK